MFCILICRTLRRRPVQGRGRAIVDAAIAALLLIPPQVVSAQAVTDFETQL
jgi:hypothetical protein